MYRSSDIPVSFSSIGSVTTVNTSLTAYTVVLAGTSTNTQELSFVYNGVRYNNSASVAVVRNTTLVFSSITLYPYVDRYTGYYDSGLIYINGTNTGARTYTITSLTGDITVTNATSVYHQGHCGDSSGCGGEGG